MRIAEPSAPWWLLRDWYTTRRILEWTSAFRDRAEAGGRGVGARGRGFESE